MTRVSSHRCAICLDSAALRLLRQINGHNSSSCQSCSPRHHCQRSFMQPQTELCRMPPPHLPPRVLLTSHAAASPLHGPHPPAPSTTASLRATDWISNPQHTPLVTMITILSPTGPLGASTPTDPRAYKNDKTLCPRMSSSRSSSPPDADHQPAKTVYARGCFSWRCSAIHKKTAGIHSRSSVNLPRLLKVQMISSVHSFLASSNVFLHSSSSSP